MDKRVYPRKMEKRKINRPYKTIVEIVLEASSGTQA